MTYGVRVGVRVNEADILPRVLEHLPPNWKPTSAAVDCSYSIIIANGANDANERAAAKRPNETRRVNILSRDGEEIVRTSDVEQLFEIFESSLQIYVAEMSPHRVFIHAGVVGWRGQAILIPGRSMSGKTTLVRELVRAGAVYYSDEYAVLDERGRVHPYPKPLSVREGETSKQTKRHVEEYGGRAGVKPLPIGLVVVSKFRREAKRWQPRRLSEGRAALEMLDHAVSARRQPEKVCGVLQKAVHHALIIKGTRGDGSKVVPKLLQLFNDLTESRART